MNQVIRQLLHVGLVGGVHAEGLGLIAPEPGQGEIN